MNPPRNIAASVRQRLLNLARQQREEFQSILTRYARERLLYRLSQSEYRDTFILKGATVFSVWSNEPHRATQDLDLLGYGEANVPHLEQVFRNICRVQVESDGLDFKVDTVGGEQTKEDQEYQGVRIKLTAFLGTAQIPMQIDIGFGDAITPAPVMIEFPTLLDLPAPRLRAYSQETVVAEKFQAMVMLGIANSRMKDFYDLWFLSQQFTFDGEALSLAILATFNRRRTPLPTSAPLALTPEFSEDKDKQKQWNAFIRKGKLRAGTKPFSEVVAVLQDFLMPPTLAVANNEPLLSIWHPAGYWAADEER